MFFQFFHTGIFSGKRIGAGKSCMLLALVLLFPLLPVLFYLLCVFLTLLTVIVIVTRSWFRIELQHKTEAAQLND